MLTQFNESPNFMNQYKIMLTFVFNIATIKKLFKLKYIIYYYFNLFKGLIPLHNYLPLVNK